MSKNFSAGAPRRGAKSTTPVHLPPGPKSPQISSPFTGVLSPQYDKSYESFHVTTSSSDRSSKPSTSSTASYATQRERTVKALPGTMSSRSESETYRSGALTPVSGNGVRKKSSLVRRCKSAVKDVLTSSPPDQSELVYIEQHHWADDS